MSGRIFGIGLSRTGTASLTVALRVLGYSVIQFPANLESITGRDAATDLPMAFYFREMDHLFPGSRFILTVRDLSAWLASCERFWKAHQAAFDERPNLTWLHEQVYGTAAFDRRRFTAAYLRHQIAVRRHFAHRRADLLVLDVCGGAGWGALCPFLGVPEPDTPFPHHNRDGVAEPL